MKIQCSVEPKDSLEVIKSDGALLLTITEFNCNIDGESSMYLSKDKALELSNALRLWYGSGVLK